MLIYPFFRGIAKQPAVVSTARTVCFLFITWKVYLHAHSQENDTFWRCPDCDAGCCDYCTCKHCCFGSGIDTEDGLQISATADFTLTPGQVALTLTNTTPFTKSAAQLLTKIEFRLDSLTAGTLSAASANSISVASDGSITNNGSVDLLSPATWSLSNSGGLFDLNFNPNAEFAIIGAAEAGGTYVSTNGSIKDNAGHNPFSDGTASFTLSVSGVTANTPITDVVFYFGTAFQSNTSSVPLPATSWIGLTLIAGIAGFIGLKRSRQALA